MAYLNGDGVKADASKAVQWLRVAEGQNFAEAQYTLGVLLLEGKDGIEKNTVAGLTFLQEASSQDHQLAARYLEKYNGAGSVSSPISSTANDRQRLEEAKKAYTGVGVSKDYDKAFAMFYPLAKSGNAEAARFIGLMKFSGKGTNKNIKEARQWLSVASQKGDKPAKELLEKYQSLFR
jgi:TPR repeat protein